MTLLKCWFRIILIQISKLHYLYVGSFLFLIVFYLEYYYYHIYRNQKENFNSILANVSQLLVNLFKKLMIRTTTLVTSDTKEIKFLFD